MAEKTDLKIGSTTWVEQQIHDFWATSPQNSLANGTGEKAWDEPLIGFVAARHPLFKQFAETTILGDILDVSCYRYKIQSPRQDQIPIILMRNQSDLISCVLKTFS
jgi:hypothetical protein